MNNVLIGLVLGIYGVMSVLTFLAFGADKRAAKLGKRRIPEARLHLMELAFGWPGAFLGRRLLRHKSSKASYSIVFWLIGVAWIDYEMRDGYDFRRDNPRNRNVRGVEARQVRELWPEFDVDLSALTLLPPLARRLGSQTARWYPRLSRVSALNTHLIGTITKR